MIRLLVIAADAYDFRAECEQRGVWVHQAQQIERPEQLDGFDGRNGSVPLVETDRAWLHPSYPQLVEAARARGFGEVAV